uniref:Uncharacterized protein n=1 Tax=viral metagenome TaxID=1070528 RepID=A0A6C0APD8_9ZZZZ
MANAGTLLSDLDGKAPLSGDGDLVKMIYQDMNSNQDMRPGTSSGMTPGGVQGPMMPMPPPQQSTQQYHMDSGPPTAHIIGGQHPTAADFAQMLQSSTPGFAAAGNWDNGSAQQGSAQQAQLAAQIASLQASQGKAWSAYLGEEMKTPILIAILVFVVNLPFLSILVAHYAPWMLKSSGDMNIYGQLSRALLVGALFWGSNRILLPLL